MPRTLAATLIALAAASPAPAEEGPLIASMDDMIFRNPKEKGAADLVEGVRGRAIRFRFEKDARGVFFTGSLKGDAAWDRAEGFSFWVKGTGPDGFGGLEFIYDEDYAVRHDYCFPVKGSGWSKVVVAWSDLIPVLPGPKARPLGGPDGNLPSKLAGPWVGKWWYWGDYPPVAFAIDEIRLEQIVDRIPTPDPGTGPPLGRVRAKLTSGRPITVVTMGDSLTDKRHWANREICWVDLFKAEATAKYRSDATIVNPAIGGTQLRQNLVLIPRWLETTLAPDLVTIFFGGNDLEAGMTGVEFRRACGDAVDRIRRATKGQADVLILTTSPSAARWGAIKSLAEACRLAADDRHAGLADVEAAFVEAGHGDREKLFVDDRVHLTRPGHDLVAGAVLAAIEAAKP